MTFQSTEPKPTLTQVQIIQSLTEALAWFEKELSWGVPPAELNHLTGDVTLIEYSRWSARRGQFLDSSSLDFPRREMSS